MYNNNNLLKNNLFLIFNSKIFQVEFICKQVFSQHRLNICRKNVAETIQLCEIIMQEVMTKNVKENPPHFREMSLVMLEGVACIDFTIDVESSMAFCHKLHGVPCTLIIFYTFYSIFFRFFSHNHKMTSIFTLDEKLSFLSWLNMKYHEMVFSSCSE